MITYKVTLAYDGTHYAGWQRLGDKKTLQGKIEEVLSKFFDMPIEIFGAGRTDAGVHAMGQVMSFSVPAGAAVPDLKLYEGLNHYLPSDIRALEVVRCKERFHARHQALSKHYRYLMQQDIVLPFERDFCVLAPGPMNLEAMYDASQVFVGTHDFTSFSNTKIGKKSAVKRIDAVDINMEDGQIAIDFFGEGFLYHMVRKMVSTLMAVGLGELTPKDVHRILEAKDRSLVPGLAPAKGLFLVHVAYEEIKE